MTVSIAARYSKASVLDAYARSGNLRSACDETGAPPYIAYIWLRKAGALKPDDKSRYGSRVQKMGAEAEVEFKRLVPSAMDANAHLQTNCPAFDFDIGGVTVDVKYSAVRASTGRWEFKTAKHKPMRPDFYEAFFACDAGGKLSGGYRLLLIPAALFDGRASISLRPDDRRSDLWFFEIEPEKLAATLAEGAGE